MKMLRDNTAVQKMRNLLTENGRKEQVAEYTALIAALDDMGQQFNVLSEKLWDVKHQLADFPEQRDSAQDAVFHAVMIAGGNADLLHYRLFMLQEQVASLSVSSVLHSKQTGDSTLGKVLPDLTIQDVLNDIQKDNMATMSAIEECIRKVETSGQELYDTGKHLKASLERLQMLSVMLTCIGKTADEALTSYYRLESFSKCKIKHTEKFSVQSRAKQKASSIHVPVKTRKFHGEER